MAGAGGQPLGHHLLAALRHEAQQLVRAMTCGVAMPRAHATCGLPAGHAGKHRSPLSKVVLRRLHPKPNPALMETELGIERKCSKCGEWWPHDTEFYYADADGLGGLTSRCRACFAERYGRETKRGPHADRGRIVALLDGGVTPAEVGLILGTSRRTIYRAVA